MKSSLIGVLTFLILSTSAIANEIKLYTSASLTSGTYQILSFLIKEVDSHKIVIQSIPGAQGLNAFNRFNVEERSILFNQDDSFKVHNISLSEYRTYDLINNPHSVIISTTSNINTVEDLFSLSKTRKLFHGRLSSGATADISLDVFLKRYNIINVENIKSYKRVEELTLALSNNELDFVIRSLASFNNSNLVKSIFELDIGSKWTLVYKDDMQNVIAEIINTCKTSKNFLEFMKKMNQNQLLCIKS